MRPLLVRVVPVVTVFLWLLFSVRAGLWYGAGIGTFRFLPSTALVACLSTLAWCLVCVTPRRRAAMLAAHMEGAREGYARGYRTAAVDLGVELGVVEMNRRGRQ